MRGGRRSARGLRGARARRAMTGVDDLEDVRECLSRLAFAFTGLLGNRLDPAVAGARLRELAGIVREVGDLCDQRAKDLLGIEARDRGGR